MSVPAYEQHAGMLQVIRDRQDAVALLMHAPADVLKGLRSLLSKIRDIPKILHRMRVTQGPTAKDFGLLTESLANLTLLKHAMLSADLVRLPHIGSSAGLSNSLFQSDPNSLSGQHVDLRAGPSQAPGIVRKALICIDESLQTCEDCSLLPGMRRSSMQTEVCRHVRIADSAWNAALSCLMRECHNADAASHRGTQLHNVSLRHAISALASIHAPLTLTSAAPLPHKNAVLCLAHLWPCHFTEEAKCYDTKQVMRSSRV